MAAAEKSLKEQNRIPLLLVIAANALALYLMSQAIAIQADGFAALVNHWVDLLPAGGVFAVTSVVTEFLDNNTKARLVFWRWNDPLPGARAFSELAHRDSRIDIAALEQAVGTLPTTPRDQNSRWYRLYLPLQSDPRIRQVHRNFLFTRDYTALCAIFLIAGIPLGLWLIAPIRLSLWYALGLGVQYLAVRLAAKHHGDRFVTTVLALTAGA